MTDSPSFKYHTRDSTFFFTVTVIMGYDNVVAKGQNYR